MKWTGTADTWTAEADGQRWTIRKRAEGISLHTGGGYVATFPSVDAAKREAGRIAQADDVPAELQARRVKAGQQTARRWVKAARESHGGKP